MSNESDSGSFTRGLFLGAIIGGLVGAVTALLLAPKSGAEFRKEIVQKSSEIYDKASDLLQTVETNVSESVSSTMNEGKAKAQHIVESARTQAEEILSNAEDVLKEARSKAHVAKEGISERIQNVREATKAGVETFRSELNASNENK